MTEELSQIHIEENGHTHLTKKIKELEGLNHMIAHNLRGTSTNIKMLADVLMNKNIPNDCNTNADDNIFTINEAIEYIQEASASLINTLDTLMMVADVQLNETIRYDNCNIADIIAHVSSQLGGFIQQKNAVLEHRLAMPCISYPELYMESILYNFIHNSLKYSNEHVPLKITISTYERDGRPVLSVKDNGLGINLQAYGRKIFNLYQVFHPGYESKGVGLYIIKTQIESFGGHISVKSEVNEGCEFIVEF